MSAARPLALGYIREDVPMSDAEVAEASRALTEFAHSEGYTLGTVYVERIDRTPAAFEALVASAIRGEAAAVMVPGPHRVALVSAASAIRGICPLDAPPIPQSGEAGALSTTRPLVEVRARLAAPTRHSLDKVGPGRTTGNECN